MNYAEQQRNPAKHALGIGVVVAMHLLLGWALVTGLARKVVEVVRVPIEARIIEATAPSPPPEARLPPPPKLAPPPPSFVPPPEVAINPPPAPAPSITVPPVAPPPTAIAPPAPEAQPAPPTPATAPSLDFNRCEKPEYNAAARRAEAQGITVVVYTMDIDGRIADARIERSSGPTREHRMLDNLTLAAVKACRGRPGTIDGKPQRLTSRVEYVWKLVD